MIQVPQLPLSLTPKEYRALLRDDFCSFIIRAFDELYPNTAYQHNWHIEVLAAKLQAVQRGALKRLVIMIPPRSLKSHCASICLPAFILGHDPTRRILCASYSQDLASKLALDCRRLMRSPWYLELFAHTRLLPEKAAVDEFMTTQMGFRLATSVGGTLTGKGGDYLIVDDGLKAEDAYSDVARTRVNDWFGNTLYSRLNSKQDGAIIVIMQRLHEDDLAGHLLKQQGWEVVAFPAIAPSDERYQIQTWAGPRVFTRRAGEALHPAREPLEVLALIREQLGEYDFAGQYQQTPAPLGGGIVKREWLTRHAYAPWQLPARFECIVQSWDSAAKASELADYSVCTTWGVAAGVIYLLDVWRQKVDYPQLKRAALALALQFCPDTIFVEDKSSGIELIQELAQAGIYGVKPYTPSGEKVMRLHQHTGTIELGQMRIPQQAPWLPDYVAELTTFPRTRYADQVDSTTQALACIKQMLQEPALITYYGELCAQKRGISAR
jgi:predicted phage terminase large subunit-like protein